MQGEWDEVTQVRARSILGASQVLLADADPAAHRWVRTIVAGHFGLEAVDTGERALDRIAAGDARLVIIGNALRDMSGSELIARAAQWLVPERRGPVTFLLAGEQGYAPEVDDRQIKVFYRLVRTMPAERVRGLLSQAAAELPPVPPKEPSPALAALVASYVKKINDAPEPSDAAREAIRATISLVGADRARCLYCDDESGALWSGTEEQAAAADVDPLEDAHASGGIAGFAVRTVAAIALPHANSDPMYSPEIDDPHGTGRERIAVQPVAGPDGHVHAVLVAIRSEQKPPFHGDDLDKLEALALAWAPYLLTLSMRIEADHILGDKLDEGPSEMFRQEAIQSLVRRGARGDVVRVHPGWVRAAYWLVLLSLIGAATFAAFARVHQYAEGPAVVTFDGRTEVRAFEGGTIQKLEVKSGDKVTRDQPLAQLYNAAEARNVRELEQDFDGKLVAYLQKPTDPAVRSALQSVVTKLDASRKALQSRVIRAPHAGTIKEVLVRNGQSVESSTMILSIVKGDAIEEISVYAFLPGSERPRIRPRQHLRLTIPGYRGATIGGEVSKLSDVLDADKARSLYLGDRIGASLPVKGTVVVVVAKLTSPEFESDGQKFLLHDGMMGMAEVKLQSRTLLETLVPGLQR